ncbi:hypothetical protein ABT336_00215 [Micromonospora sp. NPDC000207]|uniref:hypothetical protein n=1 Tax=Micromonospora sp. NPDC000207 TaxID=3154246 RepID=UPI0033332D85
MQDHEWSLVYPGTALTWGPRHRPVINRTKPEITGPELRVDDADLPRGDGRMFGQDFRSGAAIVFNLGMIAASEQAVRDLAAEVTAAWRGDRVRSVPGAVAELRARYAGRERTTYGRPRRCDLDYRFAEQGVITGIAEFAMVADCWYGPTESTSVGIAPGVGGGLVAPLSAPLLTTQDSDRSAAVTVTGLLPARPVLTVLGPIVNPTVELVGLWSIGLQTTLAYDQAVTVDTRPWARSVLRSGGGSAAGALTRQSPRLADATIPAGVHELVLRGTDGTGTARAELSWQPTYPSL